MSSTNSNSTIKKATVKTGDYAGLEMRFIPTPDHAGMKAAQITHPEIDGFEARSMVLACMTFSELFVAFRDNVRLVC